MFPNPLYIPLDYHHGHLFEDIKWSKFSSHQPTLVWESKAEHSVGFLHFFSLAQSDPVTYRDFLKSIYKFAEPRKALVIDTFIEKPLLEKNVAPKSKCF